MCCLRLRWEANVAGEPGAALDAILCRLNTCDSAAAALRKGARVDEDAIVILEVASKKTAKTPSRVVAACQRRMRDYDDA